MNNNILKIILLSKILVIDIFLYLKPKKINLLLIFENQNIALLYFSIIISVINDE